MKRWVIAVVWMLVTSCPAVSIPADSTFDSGKTTRFTFPLITIPFGSSLDSDAAKRKEDTPNVEEKDKEAKRQEKEKAAIDKKIDDAINKAWGRETTETPVKQE